VSSLFAARVINRFGTPRVTALSTIITASSLLGYSLSGNIFFLCLCAIPLGLGAGAIDAGLNNYVSLHYSATQMSLLHCFYGIGVSVSPYVASLLVETTGGWRAAYRTMFFVQLGISLVTVLSLPVWKKAHGTNGTAEEEQQETVPLKKLIKMPAVVLSGLMLFGAVAVECTAGAWSSTYFVNSKNFSPDSAAAITTFFYAGLAFGRLVSQGGKDIVGPGQAKGHHHADFQKLCHKSTSFFQFHYNASGGYCKTGQKLFCGFGKRNRN
jgi:fucose permease